MTISNLPSRESTPNQLPEQSFDYRTADELLFDVQLTAGQSDIYLLDLTTEQQPVFSQIVHTVLNKYYLAQHKSEWETGKDNGIAPPLPHQWVSSRLTKYYETAHKGDGDKVHANNIKADRKAYLPIAFSMSDALPEINTAMDIQALLDDSGHDIAADAISDVLVVYGMTIQGLREKQAQLQREKLERANRAAQSILSAELLQ